MEIFQDYPMGLRILPFDGYWSHTGATLASGSLPVEDESKLFQLPDDLTIPEAG